MTVRSLTVSYNAERLELALRAKRGDTKSLGRGLADALLNPGCMTAQKRLNTYGVWLSRAGTEKGKVTP